MLKLFALIYRGRFLNETTLTGCNGSAHPKVYTSHGRASGALTQIKNSPRWKTIVIDMDEVEIKPFIPEV